jgi:hypothetical protein
MGHVIHVAHPQRGELQTIAASSQIKGWSRVLTEYANTDLNEYIAEAFTAYVKGDTDKLDPNMVNWFKKYDKAAK